MGLQCHLAILNSVWAELVTTVTCHLCVLTWLQLLGLPFVGWCTMG